MKSLYLKLVAILVLSGFMISYAQKPIILWKKNYGGSLFDQPFGTEQTMSGGLISGGHALSSDVDIPSNNGDYDWWILKLDKDGNKLWSKAYGGTLYDKARYAAENPDSTVIAFGSVRSNDIDVSGNHGDNDYWLLKLDKNGNRIWAQCYGGTKEEGGRSAIHCLNGNYICAGYTHSNNLQVSNNYGAYDVWLVEVDPDSGNIVWEKCFGGSDVERVRSIYQWPNGDYVFTGNSNSNDYDLANATLNGGEDMWTCKIDSDGNVIWSHLCGSIGKDRAYNVTRDWDGHVLVTGKDSLNSGCVDDNHGSSDVWLMKLDFNTGQLIWEKSFGGTLDDEGFRTIPTPDHGYLVGATSQSDDFDVPGNRGLSDYWVFKTDSLLNIEWSVNWGGGSWDHLNDVVELPDGSYAAVGFSSSDKGPKSMADTNYGSFDTWIVRFINCDTVPDIAISGATSFCEGGQVTLSAPVSQTYLWSNGATTQSITADTSSSYTVMVTSFDSACVGYSSAVQITEYSLPPSPVINGSNGTFTASQASHYQWYLNGNILVNDTNQTLVPVAFGAYSVVVTDSNGCTATSTTFIYTSINELNTSKDFAIYPNPASNKMVWVENKGVDVKNANIRIVSNTSAVVKSANAATLKTGNKLYFDLSQYAKGYYRILIDTPQKQYAYPLILR